MANARSRCARAPEIAAPIARGEWLLLRLRHCNQKVPGAAVGRDQSGHQSAHIEIDGDESIGAMGRCSGLKPQSPLAITGVGWRDEVRRAGYRSSVLAVESAVERMAGALMTSAKIPTLREWCWHSASVRRCYGARDGSSRRRVISLRAGRCGGAMVQTKKGRASKAPSFDAQPRLVRQAGVTKGMRRFPDPISNTDHAEPLRRSTGTATRVASDRSIAGRLPRTSGLEDAGLRHSARCG